MAVWKRKDTNRWLCDFRYNGQRYRRIIKHARTKKEAEQAEKVIMADVFRQGYGLNKKKDITFDEFVATKFLPYSEANKRTFNDDVLYCRMFIKFFGKRSMRNINSELVESFKQKRMATQIENRKKVKGVWVVTNTKPRSPATVNRELSILSRIFSLAHEYGFTDENPCSRVKRLRIDNLRERCLTDEEERALFDALGDAEWVKHIVTIALHTGMRRGEIFNLKWFDLDFTRECIHIRQSKNGRARVVPMNETIKALFRSLPKASEFIVPSPKTGQKVSDCGRQFERAVKTAKIDKFRFHDLRHTAATRMAANGTDPFSLA